LRKSAQAVGRTRDRCDTENERVRKSLKTRRDEWKELVTRASEQREAEDCGGDPGQVCTHVSQASIAQE
jgi:hypothetical protein